MKALIVLAHPEPKSFNAHLARSASYMLAKQGFDVQFQDLYASDFDPREGADHFTLRNDSDRFDAQTEQRFSWDNDVSAPEIKLAVNALFEADLVIFQFPLWWFGPPGILKGWLDRVFVYGAMYRSSARYDTGPCRGKKAIACVTTGASQQACSHNGHEGDTNLILWPFMFSLRYVGFSVLQPNLIFGVRGGLGGDEARQQDAYLGAAEQKYLDKLRSLETWPKIAFNADGDFNEKGRLKPNAPVYSPFIRHKADNSF